MQKYKNLISFLLFGFITLCCDTNAFSATISITDVSQLALTGRIVPGDAERVIEKLIEINSDYTLSLPSLMYLNSNGGDVREALRISKLVKVLFMSTSVLKQVKITSEAIINNKSSVICASSCFFIYLSGLSRAANGIDSQSIKSTGLVGVHRPYFQKPAGGPSSAKNQDALMNEVTSYLQTERVPQSIIDIMMSHASNDIYWLTTADLNLLGEYKASYEEELIAKCNFNASQVRRMTTKEYLASRVLECTSNYYVDTYEPLRRSAFLRLRKGWRPW